MLKKMIGSNERLTSQFKVDLSRLPPCRDCLIPHIQRVNHQLVLVQRANLPTQWSLKPYDLEYGWQKVNNVLEQEWSCGAVLLPSFVDIMANIQQEDKEEIVQNFEEDNFDDK